MIKAGFVAVLALVVPLVALAQSTDPGKPLSLHAFETSEGMAVGAVFGVLPEVGGNDELVKASAPQICEHIEIHQMKEENGIMQMRQVPSVSVSEGKGDVLSAHGYHLMLMKLKEPLKAGQTFPLTLIFKQAGEVAVNVFVVSHQSE